jgi:hypothetical protein
VLRPQCLLLVMLKTLKVTLCLPLISTRCFSVPILRLLSHAGGSGSFGCILNAPILLDLHAVLSNAMHLQ